MKKYKIKINNQSFNVNVEEKGEKLFVDVNGKEYQVELSEIVDSSTDSLDFIKKENEPVIIRTVSPVKTGNMQAQTQAADGNTINSPMGGLIVRVEVNKGDNLESKTLVCIIEAMKMETEIFAGLTGKVKDIFVNNGDTVKAGQPIISVEV